MADKSGVMFPNRNIYDVVHSTPMTFVLLGRSVLGALRARKMRPHGGCGGFALSILLAFSAITSADNELSQNNHDWDVLIFTQHWPATVCYQWKNQDHSHTCAFPSQKDTWTIHGIWPTKLGHLGPNFCNSSLKFNSTLIKPIELPLEQFWINIEKDTPLYSFWEHEWMKHGTCAVVLPVLDNEMKYFAQGLRWLQLYSMSNILSKANMQPGENSAFMPLDIFNAVRDILGKNPSLHCAVDEETKKSYMFEIRICFDKSLELIDCDGTKLFDDAASVQGDKLVHCDLTKPVLYPNLVPSVKRNSNLKLPLIEIYKIITWLRWYTI